MDWIRGRRLGQGSFATVDTAVPMRVNGSMPPMMAVKSCSVPRSASMEKERAILEELKGCPHIIGCYGDCFSLKNGEKLYNVLLEYASGGSLAEKIKNLGDRRLPESEIRRYTKGLLQGIRSVHKLGYVHCDIKLQNILLFPEGKLKIADFGLAKRAGGEESEMRGTPMYMSPEMVSRGEQGMPADIWALGCVVAEMASGSSVWHCSDVPALILKIASGESSPEIPTSLSEEGKDFLRKCFIRVPGARWTATMLLNHPFVQEIDDGEKPASISPRCPFDFTDSCSVSSSQSPECFPDLGDVSFDSIPPSDRICSLLGQEEFPDWSTSSRWINIR